MGKAHALRVVFRNRAGHLRAGWRIAIYLCVVILITLSAAVISRLVRGEGHVRISTGDEEFDSWQAAVGFSILNLILIGAAWLVLRVIDRRPSGMLGLGVSRRTPAEILLGVLIGGGAIMISCIAMWAAGVLVIEPGSLDGPFLAAIGWLAVVFLVAATIEELLTRGYPFQAAVEGMGAPLAVLVFGLIFGLGHVTNQGWTLMGLANTSVSGVLMSIAYLRTRSLWMPIAIHLSWNWTQGCVWGVSVSGLAVDSSVVRTTPVGPGWLSGGEFGAEGSVITLAVLMLFTVYAFRAPWLRPSAQNARLWAPYLSPVSTSHEVSDLGPAEEAAATAPDLSAP
ncbi:MAG: CPBP family intramembrane metalloprotease [Armatimonadetes bacterium]|nr:CPBP family intramembrane metalloprotease [Armatimonadota bacterium]